MAATPRGGNGSLPRFKLSLAVLSKDGIADGIGSWVGWLRELFSYIVTRKFSKHGHRVSRYFVSRSGQGQGKHVMVGMASWVHAKEASASGRYSVRVRMTCCRPANSLAICSSPWVSLSIYIHDFSGHSIFKGRLGTGYTIHTKTYGKLGPRKDLQAFEDYCWHLGHGESNKTYTNIVIVPLQ